MRSRLLVINMILENLPFFRDRQTPQCRPNELSADTSDDEQDGGSKVKDDGKADVFKVNVVANKNIAQRKK